MPIERASAVRSRLPNGPPAMLGTFPLGGCPRLTRVRFNMALMVAVVGLAATAGCNSTPGENDYTCNGRCNGEPMNPEVIQAPDPGTACTEFLESCRGTGTCTSCS
jgi:hypothetical protein